MLKSYDFEPHQTRFIHKILGELEGSDGYIILGDTNFSYIITHEGYQYLLTYITNMIMEKVNIHVIFRLEEILGERTPRFSQ